MTEGKRCSTEERPMFVLTAQSCNENGMAVASTVTKGWRILKSDFSRWSSMVLKILLCCFLEFQKNR
jgi:hypothetical protein